VCAGGAEEGRGLEVGAVGSCGDLCPGVVHSLHAYDQAEEKDHKGKAAREEPGLCSVEGGRNILFQNDVKLPLTTTSVGGPSFVRFRGCSAARVVHNVASLVDLGASSITGTEGTTKGMFSDCSKA